MILYSFFYVVDLVERFNYGSMNHFTKEATQSFESAHQSSADFLPAAAFQGLHCHVIFKEMVAKVVHRKTVSFRLEV